MYKLHLSQPYGANSKFVTLDFKNLKIIIVKERSLDVGEHKNIWLNIWENYSLKFVEILHWILFTVC